MKKLFVSLLAISALTLSACGSKNGFDSVLPSNGSNNNGQGENNNGGGTTPVNPWDSIEYKGIANGGPSNNSLVVYIDKVNQALILVLPIPAIPIPIIAPKPIPELEGAYLTSYTNTDGSVSMAVSIPLSKIVRGGSFMPNERLPNGDRLPYVPAGELPGFAIEFPQMPKYQIHLYVGVNVAAVFIELPDVGLPFSWISPVKNASKTKEVGAIGYVAPKGNYDGGMYLAAQLPADLARAIDDLIRW